MATRNPNRIQTIITQNSNAYEEGLLSAWGKNDMFFGPEEPLGFQKDIKDCEVHLLNTSLFPLEVELTTSLYLIKIF